MTKIRKEAEDKAISSILKVKNLLTSYSPYNAQDIEYDFGRFLQYITEKKRDTIVLNIFYRIFDHIHRHLEKISE